MKKLYYLLESLILEDVGRSRVEEVIEKKQRVRIYYDPTINRGPDEEEKNEKGYRNIEVYDYGLSKALTPNPIIQAYQLNGVSETDSPGWKTFRLDRITSWRPYPSFFYAPISDRDTSVPKYRDNGNDNMTTIYKQTEF
jgi:hypothetical protein